MFLNLYMVDTGFTWIYLIFFLIPLARILPRLIKKWKIKYSDFTSQPSENKSKAVDNDILSSENESFHEPSKIRANLKPLYMLVLGELNRGTNNFDIIQKKLALDNKTLDSILEELESKGFMRVEHKKGLFGLKIELYPTEDGRKEYYL